MFRPPLMKMILWAFQVDAKNRYDTDTFTACSKHIESGVLFFSVLATIFAALAL